MFIESSAKAGYNVKALFKVCATPASKIPRDDVGSLAVGSSVINVPMLMLAAPLANTAPPSATHPPIYPSTGPRRNLRALCPDRIPRPWRPPPR